MKKSFVLPAVIIAAVFCVMHLLGLRNYTDVLSGSFTPTSMVFGLSYVIVWFAFIICTPTLLLAAVIERLFRLPESS